MDKSALPSFLIRMPSHVCAEPNAEGLQHCCITRPSGLEFGAKSSENFQQMSSRGKKQKQLSFPLDDLERSSTAAEVSFLFLTKPRPPAASLYNSIEELAASNASRGLLLQTLQSWHTRCSSSCISSPQASSQQ